MRRSALAAPLLPLVWACASGGGAPAGPLVWPAGTYYLEATVSYPGNNGTQRDLYSADLYIGPDQSMRLDSHAGVCRDPTPPEVERAASRRIMSFRCGDLTFELRPGAGTVTGDVIAVVQEGRTVTECVRFGAGGACGQTNTRVVITPARREARLRVRTVD